MCLFTICPDKTAPFLHKTEIAKIVLFPSQNVVSAYDSKPAKKRIVL